MRNMIFGFIASALTLYDTRGVLVFFALILVLPLIIFSYRAGYYSGRIELFDKMEEVIQLLNESHDVALKIDTALGDIKSLEEVSKR